jgi:hypothetical protein
VSDSRLPSWVKKRDGRLVPFDSDAISQDLYSATEALGQPDALLARELTDGVLHFLAGENAEDTQSTGAIADLVVKVVRELRHPRLAQAFADRPHGARPEPADLAAHPAEIGSSAVRSFALVTVFTRHLARAHSDGFLRLTGLEAPLHMDAAVLVPVGSSPLDRVRQIAQLRQGVAGWVVLDGPEFDCWAKDPDLLVHVLGPILDATGLKARLQLNCTEPPPWSLETAPGPLFAQQSLPAGDVSFAAEPLLDAVLVHEGECFVVDWHLGERDFEPARNSLLAKVAGAALAGRAITFLFDRPRHAVHLGPGLDRDHPALLMRVGLGLERLRLHMGVTDDVELYLSKLPSLARMAVSAGVQKRYYLRDQARAGRAADMLQRGWLMERARLLVSPMELDQLVLTWSAATGNDSKTALELARRVLKHLRQALEEEGQGRLIDCVLDVPPSTAGVKEVRGSTARHQLRAAGRLAAEAGSGTMNLKLAEGTSAQEVVELLEFAWRQSEVSRLCVGQGPCLKSALRV